MIIDAIKSIDVGSNSPAMFCVMVPLEVQQRIRTLIGTEYHPDHITLLRLTPDHSKVAPAVWYALEDAMRSFARYLLPFTCGIQGVGRFFSKNGDEQPTQAIYANVSGGEFQELRDALTDMIDAEFPEIPFFQDRYMYIPHITLDYIPVDAETPDLRGLNVDPPISFSIEYVSLVLGNKTLNFELGTGELSMWEIDDGQDASSDEIDGADADIEAHQDDAA